VAALNPRGGWFLVERAFDALSIRPDPTVNPVEVSLKADFSMHHLMTERGVDLRYGWLLAGRL
jgi:hypothetical protein